MKISEIWRNHYQYKTIFQRVFIVWGKTLYGGLFSNNHLQQNLRRKTNQSGVNINNQPKNERAPHLPQTRPESAAAVARALGSRGKKRL